MRESELQDAILAAARTLRWLCYHTHDSRRSAAGFPDLVLVRPPRLIFAELKREGQNPAPAQEEWLDALAACGALGVVPGRRLPEVYVWLPSEWLDGTITETLR